MVIGVVWLVAGASSSCIDAIDGRLTFPLEAFALLVLLECLVAFSLARSGLSLAPRLRLIQAAALAVVAILILSPWDLGDVLIAFGLAAAFAVDGLTRMVTAWYVRFPGWQVTLWVARCWSCWRSPSSCRGSRAMSMPFPTASVSASPPRAWRWCGQGWVCAAGRRAAPSPRISSTRALVAPGCSFRRCLPRRRAASR